MGYVTMEHLEGILRESWAHVCYEDDGHTWSDVEAAVVCMYLGFENGTAVAFDEWDSNGYILDNFVCPVDSVSLTDCNWDSVIHSVDGCGSRRYAGVKCFNSPCGGNFTSPSGFLYSPGYPDLYPNSANCTYFVNVTGATRLVFTFHVFQLEYNHDRVQYTQYQPTDIDSVNHGTLTGLGQQAPLEFYSNTLWMRFTTDSSVEYPGFNISWKASYESCSHRFTAESGNFTSPNYPNNYPHLANCTFYFTIPEALSITFYPRQFSVEENHDKVYFGNSTQGIPHGVDYYSGTDIPYQVNVVGNYAWVHFTTDLTVSDIGFALTWEAVLETTSCGHTFTTRSGLIESPNFPNRYPNDLYCTYRIHVNWANRIRIIFQEFDLEADYDILTYGVDNGTETTELSGSLIPDPIELMTDSMWFEFTTDGSLNYHGFAFMWEAIAAPSCNIRYTSTNGTINSPNYPNAYPGLANCTYILDIPRTKHITIHFKELALEYRYDILYYGVSDVPSVSNAIGRFTGYTTPDPVSLPYTSVWFIFESNGRGSDTGFSFSWDTTTDAPEVEITDVRVDDGSGLLVQAGYVSFDGLAYNDWVRVCYEGKAYDWGDNEARLVCQESAFSDGTAVRIDDQPTTNDGWILTDFMCDADTTNLNECTWGTLEHSVEGCGSNNYAGVRCFNAPCEGTFIEPSGVIKSPNYPRRYPAYSNCTYYINVPHASMLRIQFTTFHVESGHDYLAYYGTNPDEGANHHGTLTGVGEQQPLVFYTNKLWMRFVSDQSIEYTGFRLSYQAEYESCNKNFTSTTGNFTSRTIRKHPALANHIRIQYF
ncbi:scavenger receptor cysteine-rich domain-containing protein DMBT1-like [Amphiura filiformis]|uniref:scavenger receptor cysteine-rich domain-containing protein DMBT1-like n=1 Tax=Amphiura filiformis TaxID=82378 RepID=UPI003B22554D